MIQEFTSDLAKQKGIFLSGISLTDAQALGCRDMFILDISSNGRFVSTLVNQSDLNKLQNDSACDRLEVIVRSALTELEMLLDNKTYLL
ncbi:MAG: hypothetical protein PHY09_04350 [Desulfuromonadaceae bacterium]|nr:hypothetical protein [Desulfuromonadaceae bacterium]MDD5105724.1 hypothetical protein [Desulfuromonadaceae bacterium]